VDSMGTPARTSRFRDRSGFEPAPGPSPGSPSDEFRPFGPGSVGRIPRRIGRYPYSAAPTERRPPGIIRDSVTTFGQPSRERSKRRGHNSRPPKGRTAKRLRRVRFRRQRVGGGSGERSEPDPWGTTVPRKRPPGGTPSATKEWMGFRPGDRRSRSACRKERSD